MRWFALLLAATLLPAQEEKPLVLLANDSPFLRDQLVRVSVPFPPGAHRDLADLVVADRPTAWRVLSRWADGSVRVGQAAFPGRPGGWLAPGEILNLPLRKGKAAAGPFAPHPVWQAGLAAGDFRLVARPPRGPEATWRLGDGGKVLEANPLARTTRTSPRSTCCAPSESESSRPSAGAYQAA